MPVDALGLAAARSPKLVNPRLLSASCCRPPEHLDACGAIRYRAAAEFELRRLGRREYVRSEATVIDMGCSRSPLTNSDCPARRGPQSEPGDRRSTLPRVPRPSSTHCATCSTSSMSPHASMWHGSSSDPKREGPMKVMAAVHTSQVTWVRCRGSGCRVDQPQPSGTGLYRLTIRQVDSPIWVRRSCRGRTRKTFRRGEPWRRVPLAGHRGLTVIALVRQGSFGTAPGQVQDLSAELEREPADGVVATRSARWSSHQWEHPVGTDECPPVQSGPQSPARRPAFQ